MIERTKIGASEIKILVLIFIGNKVFLGLPRKFIEAGATAGWMIPLISGLISLVLWLLIAQLLQRFPGQSITRINEKVAGKVFGTIINLLLMLYIIFITGIALREFSEAVLITALPETPISMVALLFTVVIFIVSYIGLEPIIRSAYIAFPLIFFGTIGIFLAIFPIVEFSYLYPLLGSGLNNILAFASPYSSSFGEVIILAILVPYFSFDNKKIKQIGTRCIVSVALFLSATTLIYQLILPYPGSIESFVPFFQIARSIDFGRFFQRLEAIFVLFWTFSAFIRMSVGMYITAYLYKEIFRIPLHRPLIPALSVLFYSVALTPNNIIESVQYESIRLMIGGIFTYGLPILVLVLAIIRGKEEPNGLFGEKG